MKEYRAGTYTGRKIIMGIYRIYCTETGKSYVGASVDILHRIGAHFYAMRTWPNERQLYRDANRFGFETMKAEILEEVKSRSELNPAEQVWIEQFNSVSNGYNQQASGSHHSWIDIDG